MDKEITSIMGNDFPTEQDKRYIKIQSSILFATGPAIGVLIDLGKQGFAGDSDKLVPVKDMVGVLKETLVLVSNASCFINENRCQGIISKIKPKHPKLATFFQEICAEDMGEPLGELFGPTAKKESPNELRLLRTLMSLFVV